MYFLVFEALVCPIVQAKFFQHEKDRIRAASAKSRMQGEMAEQMGRLVLRTGATAKVSAHQRTDDFTVLVTVILATSPIDLIDNGGYFPLASSKME